MSNQYAPSFLEINLGAISRNYYKLQKKVEPGICAATIKASAYGLGVVEVAKTLIKSGCKNFFVINIDEAIELREIAQDIAIYVLYGLYNQPVALFEKYNLIPVINHLDELISFYSQNSKLDYIIHLDTGINRLGFVEDEIDDALKLIDQNKIKPLYFMTHMACADEKDHPMNEQQLLKFNNLVSKYKISTCIANSASIFLDAKFHADMVRPGIALYGIKPSPEIDWDLEPAVKLFSTILQVKTLKKGETVGYGASFCAADNMELATIAIGYADGFSRALSDNYTCYIEGFAAPVVGRVSMDLVTLDVSNVPKNYLQIGQKVEIIGDNNSVEEYAANQNTIGYEAITSLGRRFKKIYLE